MRANALLVAVCVGLIGCVGGSNSRVSDRQSMKHPQDVVTELRARMPGLKPGMPEEEVAKILSDLPLGEGRILSRTISGGKEICYDLPRNHTLILSYLPSAHALPRRDSTERPCRLSQATLTD